MVTPFLVSSVSTCIICFNILFSFYLQNSVKEEEIERLFSLSKMQTFNLQRWIMTSPLTEMKNVFLVKIAKRSFVKIDSII